MQEAKQGLLFLVVLCIAAVALLTHNAPPAPVKAAISEKETMAAGKPQTICPVMGGKIDKNLYVDVKGKRIYICCMACEDAIRVEPDKYINKIEKRGETVSPVPEWPNR